MTNSHPRSTVLSSSQRRPALVAAGAATLAGSLVALGISFASLAHAAAPTINLGAAEQFAVLGASTVTNSGGTTTIRTDDADVLGDVGVFSGTEITGIADFVWEPPAGGSIATTQESQAAQTANLAAYLQAAAQTPSGSNLTQLDGVDLLPGVYRASSTLNLAGNGTVTLDAQGDPDAEFVIQVGSSLTMEVGSTVELVGGAQACHVFWQVEEDADIKAGSTFVGTVLAENSISAGTGATFEGRLLAQVGAVTLLNNTFTMPGCSPPVVADDAADDDGTVADADADADADGSDADADSSDADAGADADADGGSDADTDADSDGDTVADGTDTDTDADTDGGTVTNADTDSGTDADATSTSQDLPGAGGPAGFWAPLGAVMAMIGVTLLVMSRRPRGLHRS